MARPSIRRGAPGGLHRAGAGAGAGTATALAFNTLGESLRVALAPTNKR